MNTPKIDPTKFIDPESVERAEDIWAKRYVPSWLFWLFRIQKMLVNKAMTFARYVGGTLFLILSFAVMIVLLTLLLPWRITRIKLCNHFGTVFGRVNMWISGGKVKVTGWEHLDKHRPAVYITNHTSALDIFLMMWLVPEGTCSVAKRQILLYPFFGQIFLLSGHIIIDRGNNAKAVASMKRLEALVREHRLSVILWPEGTRSRDGHMKTFKKGFVHMAIQTGLPIVPLVVTGANKVWQAKKHSIQGGTIDVNVLPAYDTSHWTLDNVDGAIKETMDIFNKHLPPEQRSLSGKKKDDTGVIVADWPKNEEKSQDHVEENIA